MGKACKIVQHYATTGFSTVMLAWAAHRTSTHYYRSADLSRLGNLCCPGFPTGNARPGQKGVPFCPGSGNRDKRVRQARGAGSTFCPGWCYQPGQKVPDPGQKGTPFCPGLAFPVGKPGQQRFPNRDKSTFL